MLFLKSKIYCLKSKLFLLLYPFEKKAGGLAPEHFRIVTNKKPDGPRVYWAFIIWKDGMVEWVGKKLKNK